MEDHRHRSLSVVDRHQLMDTRFTVMDKRLDDVDESFERTQWLIGLGFVLLTAVVTVIGSQAIADEFAVLTIIRKQ